MKLRRFLTGALPLLVLAGGLGLVSSPASASCAGPTLEVVGASTTRATPTPPSEDDESIATVERGASITVVTTNVIDLSEGCKDTSSGGCDSVPPAVPGKQVALILQQGSRKWTLGVADATGAERTITYDVVLPDDVKAGRGQLTIEGTGVVAAGLRLAITQPPSRTFPGPTSETL